MASAGLGADPLNFWGGYAASPIPHYGTKRGHVELFFSTAIKSLPLKLSQYILDDETSRVNEFMISLRDKHSILLGPSVSMFLLESEVYDISLHCIPHFDFSVRGLACMPSQPSGLLPKGWCCAMYIGADSMDYGTSFAIARRERDTTGVRHSRILSADGAFFHVTLEYVLRTWLLMEPEGSETASSHMNVANKTLVLFCDFPNSVKWCKTLDDWTRDPSRRPFTGPEWSSLHVRIVGRDDSSRIPVVSKFD